MSETETPRDETTGQFTGGEQKFGRAAELEAAGWKEMPEAPKPEQKTYEGGNEGLRQAADDLAQTRGSEDTEPLAREYRMDGGTGELADPKEAISIEKAARDLSAFRADVSRHVEGVSNSEIADIVDAARGELVKQNPKQAETYGLDAEDVKAKADALDAKFNEQGDNQPAPDAEPPVDGLDPEVSKALKHPQVRQAIEEELGRADAARQSYAEAVNMANQFARASLVDHIPELANIPVEQWDAALGLLHQADPQRVQRAMGVVDRVNKLSVAQAQLQQQAAAEQQRQFDTWAKAEDVRFDKLTEIQGIDRAERLRIGDEMLAYAGELGVDQATFFHLMQTNPVMRHAGFQKMMFDATRYRMMMKNAPKAAPRALPPVQKPGTAQARASHGEANIDALNKRLSATGNIKDAAKLMAAVRAARR